MASIHSHVGEATRCDVKIIDSANVADSSEQLPLSDDTLRISITQFHPSLASIVGPRPDFVLLLSSLEASKHPFFSGSCAYLQRPRDELFITSDLLQPRDLSQAPLVLISRVKLDRNRASNDIREVAWSKLRPPQEIPMPAGAVAIPGGVVYCYQGKPSSGFTSGLAYMALGRHPVPFMNNFFGIQFGSICAVALEPQGSRQEPVAYQEGVFWFVDAGNRGYEAGFRPPAKLPAMIWRYNAQDGELRAMTDDVSSPRGIVLSPDGQTVYVSDCDAGIAEKESGWKTDSVGSIYAFDVITRHGSLFLTGKRLFSRALRGVPKGLVCDSKGNIFVGCGDGVEIWNPGGTLLGVIKTPAPVSSLGWGMPGEMFICADKTLWMVRLTSSAESTTRGEGMA